jgi:hypothetical protein
MRFVAIEDVGHRLALVRGECGDVNQCLHLLVSCGCNHGPFVGVTCKDDRPGSPIDRVFDRRDILSKSRQGQRCREHLYVALREAR